MSTPLRGYLPAVALLVAAFIQVCAGQEMCYTSGGVAGIVIATFVVTIVVIGLGMVGGWFLWKRKKATPSAKENTSTEKPHTNDNKYAFDNPYFHDDEVDGTTPDSAEKGQAGLPVDNGTTTFALSTKSHLEARLKKLKPVKSLPFASVFTAGKKHRAMDDTFLAVEPEKIVVPLRGHDFTGLGFNICGNMRDGIFVKDLLHRGPASESGKIKAGDRILSVTVSFANMVYEDALTILSYASPYDVHLQLEKCSENGHVMPTASPGKRVASASFRNGGQRLFHPLYRSQSIDDLSQIGKDRDILKSGSLTPKRSQSVGVNVQKPKVHQKSADESNEEDTVTTQSSDDSTIIMSKIDNEDLNKDCRQVKNIPDLQEKSPENVEVTESMAQNQNGRKASSSSTSSSISEETLKKNVGNNTADIPEIPSKADDKPLVPPRKSNTAGKRKAPAPPKPPHGHKSLETTAQIHCADDVDSNAKVNISDESKTVTEIDNDTGEGSVHKLTESDNMLSNSGIDKAISQTEVSSDVSGDSIEENKTDEEATGPKRKASSLGDLTKLEEESSKKSPTLLERAVSLDFHEQSVPEGNLSQQKKILKTPNLDPNDTREEEVVRHGNLKKWEGSWEKLNSSSSEGVNNNVEEPSAIENSSAEISRSEIETNGHIDEETIEIDTNGNKKERRMVKIDINLNLNASSEFETSPMKSPSESSVSSLEDKDKIVTSTPAKKVIQIDSFLKDDIVSDGHKTSENGEGGHEDEKNNSKKPLFGEKKESTPPLLSNQLIAENTSSPTSVFVEIPVIPPVIRHFDKPSLLSPHLSHVASHHGSSGIQQEVMEITETGIESVNLANKQFLLKPAKLVAEVSDIIREDSSLKLSQNVDFESLNSDDKPSEEVSKHSDINGNGRDSSLSNYTTALDLSAEITASSKENTPSWKTGNTELTEVTLHSPEGGYSKTLIISTPDTHDGSSQLSPESSSPPPALQPPFN